MKYVGLFVPVSEPGGLVELYCGLTAADAGELYAPGHPTSSLNVWATNLLSNMGRRWAQTYSVPKLADVPSANTAALSMIPVIWAKFTPTVWSFQDKNLNNRSENEDRCLTGLFSNKRRHDNLVSELRIRVWFGLRLMALLQKADGLYVKDFWISVWRTIGW